MHASHVALCGWDSKELGIISPTRHTLWTLLQTVAGINARSHCPMQLLAIKQAELYNKWQQYLPEHYRDITCPKSPEDVLEKVAADKQQKDKRKRTAAASAAESTAAALATEITELFVAV